MLTIHIPLLLMSTAGRTLRWLSQTYRPCITPIPSSASGISDPTGQESQKGLPCLRLHYKLVDFGSTVGK